MPESGDPYEEIYKLQGRWYGLLNCDWINPGKQEGRGYQQSCRLLDGAKKFHQQICGIYHANSYAHYGADDKRLAWHTVTWSIQCPQLTDAPQSQAISDSADGTLQLRSGRAKIAGGADAAPSIAHLQPPANPGDETVPVFSADDQLRSGKFRGIFRQTGYEHQNSFKDEAALHSTLYSLVQIAAGMVWSKK